MPNPRPKTPTIYARVSKEDKDFLTELSARLNNASETYIVEKLISYARSLTLEEEKEIFSGHASPAVRQAGRLMERLAWGQHAFHRKRWFWALEEFMCLEEDSVISDGTWRFAQYMIAFCWVEIAIEIRRAGLLHPNSRAEHYEKADWALRATIAYNERHSVKDKQTNAALPHPVIAYNIACAWSLRAQYEIERNVDAEIPAVVSDAKKPQHEKPDFFEKWRADLNKKLPRFGEMVQDKLKMYSERAFQALSRVKERADEPPSDCAFLARLAHQDSDLLFLREDEGPRDTFGEWATTTGHDRSLLDDFSRLEQRVPKKVQDRIKELK